MPPNNRLQRTVMDKVPKARVSAPPLNRDVREHQVRRRRTRKEWYEYHLFRAREAARAPVEERHAPLIEQAQTQVQAAQAGLRRARESLPLWDRFLDFFGSQTEHHRSICRPWEVRHAQWKARLSELHEGQYVALSQADAKGEENYAAARARRKHESVARAERVVQRQHERRVRYLERSPALRSAARFFRELLLKLQGRDDEMVVCYYCNAVVHKSSAHLEHKRPISRGGNNRRSNLVMACAPCNLAKGRKTHEEFMRPRQGGVP